MTDAPFHHHLHQRFRAHPDYQLVPFDRLNTNERALLAGLRADADLYGVLRPRRPELNFKSITRAAAQLFRRLRAPRLLPVDLHAELGDRCYQEIARLVLDQILEVEVEGAFLSGVAAHARLFATTATAEAVNATAQLSLAALRYGQALKLADNATLSARLYYYNRLPAASHLRRAIPDAAAVRELLGLDEPPLAARLAEGWLLATNEDGSPWLSWRAPLVAPLAADTTTHKLYVSPRLDYLREAFWATVEVARATEGRACKIGRTLHGILRPDKLVVYFDTRAQVEEAGSRLHKMLDGMPAHGVPFTAALVDDQGLLSWGVDPPRAEHRLPWQGPSWRKWITDQLAVALIAASSIPTPTVEIDPVRFALDRVALEGIAVTTWTPALGLWD